MQPARGVDEHEIGAPARGRRHRVEHDRARVGAFLPADELATGALGPELQLVRGRGAERVARGEDHTMTFAHALRRELADRRRLPDSVDADEHPDVLLAGGEMQRAIGIVGQQLDDFVAQQRDQLVGFGRGLLLGARAHTVEEARRRDHPDIREEQRLFELVPRLVVDLAAADPAERARERLARAAEPIAQPRSFENLGLPPVRPRPTVRAAAPRAPRPSVWAPSAARRSRSSRASCSARVAPAARRPANRPPSSDRKRARATTTPNDTRTSAATTMRITASIPGGYPGARPGRLPIRRYWVASSKVRSRMRWVTTRLEPPGGIETP